MHTYYSQLFNFSNVCLNNFQYFTIYSVFSYSFPKRHYHILPISHPTCLSLPSLPMRPGLPEWRLSHQKRNMFSLGHSSHPPKKNSVICCLMLKPLISADDMWTEVSNYSILRKVLLCPPFGTVAMTSSYWFWSFIVSKVRPLRPTHQSALAGSKKRRRRAKGRW